MIREHASEKNNEQMYADRASYQSTALCEASFYET